MAVEMELVGVRVQMPTNAPILILREADGRRRTVPIYIGGPEAHAIDLALSGTPTARPMTHDLLTTMIAELGATIERVVVTELRQGTFYADLFVRDAAGDVQTFSARPSDAVAIAVRADVPIFAEEALIEDAGIEEEEDDDQRVDGIEEEEMVEQLRKFLDEAKPDDFKE
ncbi:MAG: bifunctional DNase/RNase [Acidimicrobiales bacterium]|jgi:uncharacterized protein